MAAVVDVDEQMVAEIRTAIKECSERGLSVASKWCVRYNYLPDTNKPFYRASELHLSIPVFKRRIKHTSSPHNSAFSTSTPARARSPLPHVPFVDESLVQTQPLTQPSVPITPARHPHAPPLLSLPEDIKTMEAGLDFEEEDVLTTARGCIDLREFMRAIHLLKECRSSKARFLSIYCQFIVSDFFYSLWKIYKHNI